MSYWLRKNIFLDRLESKKKEREILKQMFSNALTFSYYILELRHLQGDFQREVEFQHLPLKLNAFFDNLNCSLSVIFL